MKKYLVTISLLVVITVHAQQNYSHCSPIPSSKFPLILNAPNIGSSLNDANCREKIRVMDDKPLDCNHGGNNFFYPVLVENFNFKEELPNVIPKVENSSRDRIAYPTGSNDGVA